MHASPNEPLHQHRSQQDELLSVSMDQQVLGWSEGRTSEVPSWPLSPHIVAPQHIGHVILGAIIVEVICLAAAASYLLITPNPPWYPWAILAWGVVAASLVPFAYMSKRLGARIAANAVEATSG